jgi:murein endopeptidase
MGQPAPFVESNAPMVRGRGVFAEFVGRARRGEVGSRARSAWLAAAAGVLGALAACAPSITAPPADPSGESPPASSGSAAPVVVGPSAETLDPAASASASAPAASAAGGGEEHATGPGTGHDDDEDEDDDDDSDDMESWHMPTATSPLLALSDDQLLAKYRADPTSVGSLSVGRPAMGLLVNGVPMTKDPAWNVMGPGAAWGTEETVSSIAHIIQRVKKDFPSAPALSIGHISAKNGGHLNPHRSHQSGRDVDIAYYRKDGKIGFLDANKASLEVAPTWLLVKTALRETPVDMIFIDDSVQRLLAEQALASGEDVSFVDEVFLSRGKNARAPIRHIKGHRNHLHIRFHSPNAEALAARLVRVLPKPVPPPPSKKRKPGQKEPVPAGYSEIRARSGDTLVVWAKRYGTTIEEIQKANGLHGTALKIGGFYRIPVKNAPGDKSHGKSHGSAHGHPKSGGKKKK